MIGLSLVLPTLEYEVRLLDRVTEALGGEAPNPNDDFRPPIDIQAGLDRLAEAINN